MPRLLARLLASRSVASGAALYVGMRWFDRLIGVISTIVLARLLTPSDFGVVALALVVFGIATVMLDAGINVAVVQRTDIDDDDLDTAWTLRLIENFVVALVVSIGASLAAGYYNDPRLELVLWTIAAAYLLDGLTGMGPVIFQKRQEYAKEVGFYTTKRLFGFACTMVFAIWLRSYWALVLGMVAANAGGVALSYWMHRRFPRFTVVRWRSFVGASFWLMVRSVGIYATQELDKLVIGRRDGPTLLGAYSIASQIAAMPTSELLAPLSRALFPAMAAIKNNSQRLRKIFLMALGIQCTFALPASIGLALVATDLVPVMLGEKWASATPLLKALALAFGANALTHGSSYLLTTLGKFREQSFLQWGLAAVLALMVFVVFPNSDASQIAWIRVGVSGLSVLALTMLVLQNLTILSLQDMAGAVYRPVLATVAMSFAVELIDEHVPGVSGWAFLWAKVTVGASAYVGTLISIWIVLGKPDGAERWIFDKLVKMISSINRLRREM